MLSDPNGSFCSRSDRVVYVTVQLKVIGLQRTNK